MTYNNKSLMGCARPGLISGTREKLHKGASSESLARLRRMR